MKAGDAFFIRGYEDVDHLWIVISSPDVSPNVLIVHITTYEDYKEDACMLYDGDHARIHHDTCIAYEKARLISLEKLWELEADGKIEWQPPVSSEILQRIRNGAAESRRILLKYLQVLEDQGLIE